MRKGGGGGKPFLTIFPSFFSFTPLSPPPPPSPVAFQDSDWDSDQVASTSSPLKAASPLPNIAESDGVLSPGEDFPDGSLSRTICVRVLTAGLSKADLAVS